MDTFRVRVEMVVELEAFDEGDALEAVEDCFGQGEACGLNVVEFSIEDHEQLG